MRFEVVDRQRVQHATFVAQVVLLLCAPAAFAARPWNTITPGAETRPLAVTIGHPTVIAWRTAEHPAFVPVVLDRDLHPTVAEAYLSFASVVGVAGDPVYVVLTPHLEPLAAGADPGFLEHVAARWAADPEELLAETGLALRRHLLGKTPADLPRQVPPLQRYDWLGGSVYRHQGSFDKALIDQARFVLAHPRSVEARATLDFVLSEFTDPGGAFVAGLRADSLVPRDGKPVVIEGGYAQWTVDELRHLLGPRAADVFSFHHRMTAEGNFLAGYNVVGEPRDVGETAARFSLTLPEVEQLVLEARHRLYDVRSKRPDPARHNVLVTEYNGRMISALAKASVLHAEPRYRDAAVRALRAILTRNLRNTLMRAGDVPASPADYSSLVRAALDTYEATFDPAFIERAIQLQRLADIAPAIDRIPEPVRPLVPAVDDDLEPGNVLRLAAITGEPAWTRRAGDAFARHRQVIVSGDPDREETLALLQAARAEDDPERMLFFARTERIRVRLAAWMPYVAEVVPVEGHPVATVCQERRCRTPTSDPKQLAAWTADP